METMHIYRIFLNEKLEKYQYKYDYKFQWVSGICLEISQGFACVTIPMNAERSQEDFLDFSTYIFRDAFRKALQVHIILFGRDLFMESVSFEIDGKAKKYTRGNPPGFPFVFSMLGGREIRLTPAKDWKVLIKYILETTKFKQDQDLRFCAVFAYWAGKARPYEIDSFQNFWTAMNAYYSYFSKAYTARLAKDSEVGKQLDRWNEEHDLTGDERIEKKDLKPESENARINLLMHWLTGREKLPSQSKIQKLWEKINSESGKKQNKEGKERHNFAIERQLRNLKNDDLKRLYEAARSQDPEKLAPWKDLYGLAESINADLFCLLLLYLPYHYRNAFIHGNKTVCLFMTFNDYEYTVLHAVNLFLDRFLGKAIPGMFSENMLTDEAYESLKKFSFDSAVKLKK